MTFGISLPNDAFRTTSWTTSLRGEECLIETAQTNGTFSIIGDTSHARSGNLANGQRAAENEFGSWMDEHNRLREGLKRIYREANDSDLDCDVAFIRLVRSGSRGSPRYLVVPRQPLILLDHAGDHISLNGVEAGLAWMALAWLESLDRYGTTGSALKKLHHPSAVDLYIHEFADELALGARQFEKGARLFD